MTYRGSLGRLLCRPRPRLVEDALGATPVPVPAGMTLGLEGETSGEAEDMAGALEDAGPSEPGGLATSVASPELAEGIGVAAGSELPLEEATGVSDTLEAAGAATLEAAGANHFD
jgi:hypothetical protein